MTDRQQMFVKEYLIDLNATQAAIRAGYSKRNAHRIGPELLGKTSIKSAIDAAKATRAAKLDRQALDVLMDIRRLTKEAWELGELGLALKGLELEGKHLGMFQGNGTGRPPVYSKIIGEYQRGEISLKDAALEFDKVNLPLPESIRILLGKEQAEQEDPTRGQYSVISDEEMEKRVALRKSEIEKQIDALPERRAEIKTLHAQVKDAFTAQGNVEPPKQ